MRAPLLSLTGLLVLHSLAIAQTLTPAAANGQLKFVGRQLSNQSGKAIQLRGMSSHGLQWFDQCYTQGSVQTLANSWGIDVFRAFSWYNVSAGTYTLTAKATDNAGAATISSASTI